MTFFFKTQTLRNFFASRYTLEQMLTEKGYMTEVRNLDLQKEGKWVREEIKEDKEMRCKEVPYK